MKQTVNASIGKQAFTFDEDAYGTLRSYLDDIRSRLPENEAETMGDIEARIAELLREKIGTSSMRVVTIETVHEAMLQMGTPADFGERRSGTSRPDTTQRPNRKLTRSRNDRMIGGVCGGIAQHFGWDPSLLRIATLLLIFFGGLSIWVYIILWIVVPEEAFSKTDMNPKNR